MDVGRVLPTRQPYIICKLAPGEGREEEGNCRERVWGKFPPPPVIVTLGSADSHKTIDPKRSPRPGEAALVGPREREKNRVGRVWDGVY